MLFEADGAQVDSSVQTQPEEATAETKFEVTEHPSPATHTEESTKDMEHPQPYGHHEEVVHTSPKPYGAQENVVERSDPSAAFDHSDFERELSHFNVNNLKRNIRY